MYNTRVSKTCWELAVLKLDNPSVSPKYSSVAPSRPGKTAILEQIHHIFLFISPYRCDACDLRYFRFRLPVHGANKPRHHAA